MMGSAYNTGVLVIAVLTSIAVAVSVFIYFIYKTVTVSKKIASDNIEAQRGFNMEGVYGYQFAPVQATCIDVKTNGLGRHLSEFMPIWRYEYNGKTYTTEETLKIFYNNEAKDLPLMHDVRTLYVEVGNPSNVQLTNNAGDRYINRTLNSSSNNAAQSTQIMYILGAFFLPMPAGFICFFVVSLIYSIFASIKSGNILNTYSAFSVVQLLFSSLFPFTVIAIVMTSIYRQRTDVGKATKGRLQRCTMPGNALIKSFKSDSNDAADMRNLKVDIEYTYNNQRYFHKVPMANIYIKSTEMLGQSVPIMLNPNNPREFYFVK